MRNLPVSTGMACFVVACGLATAPCARAATVRADVFVNGSSCQLSIPTTDTKARPKSTGFRNESTTTGNFVICTALITPGNGTTDALDSLDIHIYSLDGTSRTVSCTAVSGWHGNGYRPPVYSTKAIPVADTELGDGITWGPSDFGGVNGTIPGSFAISVTCNLPPQTAINFLEPIFSYPVGS